MRGYRKKPVEVDAVEVNAALACAAHAWKGLPSWLEAAYERGDVLFARDHISIHTPEGVMRGLCGDWIIRGVKGELYPCKPDVFEATYDRTGSEETPPALSPDTKEPR